MTYYAWFYALVLVIELLPTHAIFDLAGCTQHDSEESLEVYNEQP